MGGSIAEKYSKEGKPLMSGNVLNGSSASIEDHSNAYNQGITNKFGVQQNYPNFIQIQDAVSGSTNMNN